MSLGLPGLQNNKQWDSVVYKLPRLLFQQPSKRSKTVLLFSLTQDPIKDYIVISASCLLNLEQFFSLSVFQYLDVFNSPGRYFCRIYFKSIFSACVLLIRFRLNTFRSNWGAPKHLLHLQGLFSDWPCLSLCPHCLLHPFQPFMTQPNAPLMAPPVNLSLPVFAHKLLCAKEAQLSLSPPCHLVTWFTDTCISGQSLNTTLSKRPYLIFWCAPL